MVAAYAVPGDAGRKGYAKACADEFADRHRAVGFQDHMGHEAGHAAVEVGDGAKAGACFQGNKACLFKFVQVDRRFPCMRVGIRHSQHDVFLQEGDRVVILDGIDRGREEEIHMVLVLLARLVVLLQDFETNVRMLLAEAGEESRDDHGCCEERNGDGELLGFLGVSQFLLGAVELLHDAVRMAQQDFAVAGEDDISTASGKQRHPKLRFQNFDGVRQGWLRNMKRFGRAGQVL